MTLYSYSKDKSRKGLRDPKDGCILEPFDFVREELSRVKWANPEGGDTGRD